MLLVSTGPGGGSGGGSGSPPSLPPLGSDDADMADDAVMLEYDAAEQLMSLAQLSLEEGGEAGREAAVAVGDIRAPAAAEDGPGLDGEASGAQGKQQQQQQQQQPEAAAEEAGKAGGQQPAAVPALTAAVGS